jgi:triosephosphate isomerase
MSAPRPIIAGNWKMHGLEASLAEARAVASWLDAHAAAARVALCPPATLIDRMAQALAGTGLEIGGQDCSAEAAGAHTGDVSAAMLFDAGARLVILGHSERRADHGETDALVAAKVRAAMAAGLEPIVCVGESREAHKQGRAADVVCAQIAGSLPDDAGALAIAYEPIWAIGSGETPTSDQIEAVHAAIREALVRKFGGAGAAFPILYGGSVKPDNAAEILPLKGVGGALVGGASLKAADFTAILAAL